MNETPKAASLEDRLGPAEVDLVSVGLGTLGGIIAGFFGGLLSFVASYVFVGMTQVAGTGVYPYLLSLVAFFSIVLTVSTYFVFMRMLFPDKYRGAGLGFGQILLFCIFSYACVTPLYIAVGIMAPEQILTVFAIHVTLAVFGSSLVLEIVSNYRYVLLGVYGSFFGLFGSVVLTAAYFFGAQESARAIYSLLALPVVIAGIMTFVRLLFEAIYSFLYRQVGIDPLGDIFERIEQEELGEARRAERELVRFGKSDDSGL
jgi:hypothetical protein